MSVGRIHDEDLDLTILRATGKLTFDDMMAAVKDFYENSPTAHVIWDTTEVEEIQVSSAELSEIAVYTKENGRNRPEGRTALVVSTATHYGLGRMFSIFAKAENRPWPVLTCAHLKEAMKWISEAQP
jgi:hypothetical protein